MNKKEAIKQARKHVNVFRSCSIGGRSHYIVSFPAFLDKPNGHIMHSLPFSYRAALASARREVALVAATLLGWGEAELDAIIYTWLWDDEAISVEQLLTKAKAKA